MRQAVDGPPRLIVVIGVWLILLPAFIALPVAVVQRLTIPESQSWAFAAVYFAVAAVILWRTTANYLRKRRAGEVQ